MMTPKGLFSKNNSHKKTKLLRTIPSWKRLLVAEIVGLFAGAVIQKPCDQTYDSSYALIFYEWAAFSRSFQEIALWLSNFSMD
jgi:hypothetical protein